MRRIRIGLFLLALVAIAATTPARRVKAEGEAIRHFALVYIEADSGHQNPQPVDAATYAVYNGVLEFATTTPDGVRRIVLGVPLTNVRGYFEYNYNH